METLSTQIRNALESVKKEFPVDSLYLFGSYARGDQRSESDLDLLVVFSTVEKDPFDLAYQIRRRLHDQLELALDVVVTSKELFEERIRQPWTVEHVAHTEGIAV